MKNLILILSTFLIATNVYSQEYKPIIQWGNTYGEGNNIEIFNSTLETPDNGFLFGGQSETIKGIDITYGNIGLGDYLVIKTDSAGNIEWLKKYGGTGYDVITSMVNSIDGGYIIGGRTRSVDGDIESNHGGDDIWLVKITNDGEIEWEKTYGGKSEDYLQTIISKNNGYLIGGSTNSNDGDIQSENKGQWDFWVINIDDSGNIIWEKCYGGANVEYLRQIHQTTDNCFLLTGYTRSNDGDIKSTNHGLADFWVVKVDKDGILIWEKTYGGENNDNLNSSIITVDNGLILGGRSESVTGDVKSHNHGEGDFWIVRIDSIGNIIWENQYGGSLDEMLNYITNAHDGGYILTGWTESNDGDINSGNHSKPDNCQDWYIHKDAWVLKIDNLGKIVWEKTFGGSNSDNFRSVKGTKDSCYILAGSTSSNDGDILDTNIKSTDAWAVKLDEAEILNSPFLYHPRDTTLAYCLSQEEVDMIFNNWIEKISKSLADTSKYQLKIFNGNPPNICDGTNYVRLEVQDTTGISENYIISFTVPITRPKIIKCPEDLTTDANLTGSKIDSIYNQWLNSYEFGIKGDCELRIETLSNEIPPIGGSTKVTWLAYDICENYVECSATFSISNSDNSNISCPKDTILYDQCDPYYFWLDNLKFSSSKKEITKEVFVNIGGSIIDTCGSITITYSDEITKWDCPYEITRTFTKRDTCNEYIACKQKITLIPEMLNFYFRDKYITVEYDGNGNKEELQSWLNSYAGFEVYNCLSEINLLDTTTTLLSNDSYIIVATFLISNGCENWVEECTFTVVNSTSSYLHIFEGIPYISIFPNPNNGKFKLRFVNVKSGKNQVRVIDELGQIQVEKEVYLTGNTQEEEIDLSHISKGNYFVRILDGNSVYTKKIILH